MPNYRFHIVDNDLTEDETRLEFASDMEARRHAVEAPRVLASEDVLDGVLVLSHRIDLAREGECIASIRFSDVVRVEE